MTPCVAPNQPTLSHKNTSTYIILNKGSETCNMKSIHIQTSHPYLHPLVEFHALFGDVNTHRIGSTKTPVVSSSISIATHEAAVMQCTAMQCLKSNCGSEASQVTDRRTHLFHTCTDTNLMVETSNFRERNCFSSCLYLNEKTVKSINITFSIHVYKSTLGIYIRYLFIFYLTRLSVSTIIQARESNAAMTSE
jgi:hypothetical protein